VAAAVTEIEARPDYRAAKEGLAHRMRFAAILEVGGPDRVAFLQGQLTADIAALGMGEVRPAAGLTPKGKLIFLARIQVLPDRLRLLVSGSSRTRVLEHLRKYAVFQKASIVDASDDLLRIGLYGPQPDRLDQPPGEAVRLPGEGEFSAEMIAPAGAREEIEVWLRARGSALLSEETAEVLRVEAGRPRFGQDADESHLPDEVGLEAAISTTKGCYVGQEVVARLRTYGRVNRRLVGFRFPQTRVPPGALLKKPEEPSAGKVEQGRITSSVVSPRFGPIGLGYAFREVPVGGILVWAEDPSGSALVAELPFE
jgi:folate-binding protein YgfZ